MKFLVDAQLPPALARFLRETGCESAHVSAVALLPGDDNSIWHHADRNQLVIVSKDEDFAIRRMASPLGPAVLWLRVGNCSDLALRRWFVPLLPDIIARLECGETLVEVI